MPVSVAVFLHHARVRLLVRQGTKIRQLRQAPQVNGLGSPRSGAMSMQFATDGVPAYRRLALWQDIVCDVYVQLDCKSDLGNAFNGRITRESLGEASCT